MASQCEPFKTEILERVLKNKEKPSSVAKSLNLNTQAVLLFVKKYGWENKVDIINENYFSQIDTHAKAYLFGFLLGDGCITTMKNGKNMLTVTIHEQDRHILDFLSDELGLIHRRPTSPYKNNNVRKQHMVRLTLMNDQITSDLEKLGMIPRKSLTLGDFLPVVPEELLCINI
jgi:DNA-binding transcriptional regulator WhiA